MPTVLLSTTYFGPIQWYQKLCRYPRVLIEQHETFQKQTYRNRCLIATTQGVQPLTVPVVHSSSTSEEAKPSAKLASCIMDCKLSDHGNWRHLHWQALQSAYGDSPFFEYYEDDLRPFFTERRWERLLDFNEAIRQKMCELLDIQPNVSLTTSYIPIRQELPRAQHAEPSSRTECKDLQSDETYDFREAIRPKHPLADPDFVPHPYYQVFAQKHGFLPNLSILDLLFNMGPESIFYL